MASRQNINDAEKSSSKAPAKESFFQSLFASLFKSNNPEAEKKRKLKAIAKAYSKSRYHSFYKPGSGEMQASFGKLIYDIYKAVAPAQTMFKNAPNPAIFKRQIINYLLSEEQADLISQLDEQNILQVAKKIPIAQLQKDIDQKLQTFTNSFDDNKQTLADNLCKAFTLFQDFCNFDFYMIIKKYDSSYQEYNFSVTPRLDKVNSGYIVNEIKDFLTVAYAITDDTVAWTDLFTMLKETQNRDIVSLGTWKKIVAKIRSIQVSHSLDLAIQHMSEDPDYETKFDYHYTSLLEPYVDKIEQDTRALVQKIAYEQKESKANSICMQIFGTADPQSLKYYVSGFNAALEKKDLSVLEYTEPLNYLKTFLVEFVKSSIREFYDVVVIRGQWDATLSAPFSNSYQELLKVSDEITAFDEMFSEEGQMGMKIKTLLPKTAHDAGAENIINRVVSDGNDQARGFIIQSTQNLITIGKVIKQLIEDYSLSKPVIVQNWKELEKYIETPMKEFSVNIYKKIYLFVQLMQTYIQ